MTPGKRAWLTALLFASACGGRAGFEVGDFDPPEQGGSAGDSGASAGGRGGAPVGGAPSGGFPSGGFPSGGSSFAGAGVGGVAGGAATGGSSFAGFAGFGAVAGVAGFPAGGRGGDSSIGGQGGFSGAGGAGGGMLGEPCAVNGALACHGAAQKLMLRCDGGFWRANGTCGLADNCDQRTGVCTPIAMECVNRLPGQTFCRGDVLVACGPDNVTVEDIEDCAGRCAETGNGAACVPPNCGDGRTQAPEECDDGNPSDTDACTTACRNAVCGDGFIRADRETCDDGNATPRDGCSSSCLREPSAVVAGTSGTCALGVNGAVQCWGNNTYGQLGLGNTLHRGDSMGEVGPNLAVVDLGTGRTAKAVFRRGLTSCAILDDDRVKCWGYNVYGQLGQGDTLARGNAANQMGDSLPAVNLGTGRTARTLDIGAYHVCAILDDESLKCWGNNTYGQLGQGDALARGDGAGEMGDALPAVNVGTGRTVRAVATGTYHTCVILDDGRVKCWGYNAFGQLGQGDTLNRGDEPGEMNSLRDTDLGTGRTARLIAAGTYQTCAVLDNDQLKCWGHNSSGQLGIEDTLHRGDQSSEMGDALPPVNLGTGRSARAVSAGDGFTCALLDTNQLKCWGTGANGRLGLGDTVQRGDGFGEMGDALPALSLGTMRSVTQFALGAAHGCALLDDLTIKCWGQNATGALGLGDTNHRGDVPNEMGDALPAVPNGF